MSKRRNGCRFYPDQQSWQLQYIHGCCAISQKAISLEWIHLNRPDISTMGKY